jgi:hypothetical protein
VGRVLVLAPVEAMGASPGVGEAAVARADAAAESFEGAAMPVSDDAEDGNGEAAAWLAVSTGAAVEGAEDDAVLRVVKVSYRAASHPSVTSTAAATPKRTTRGTAALPTGLGACGIAM